MKILFFFLFSLNAYSSTAPDGCGVFDIYGRMDKSKAAGEFRYVVHGKTTSEYKFKLNEKQEIKLAPYFERYTKIRATILKEIIDFNGEFFEIESVNESVPDPAFLTKNHGFTLVKKESCK